MDTAAYDYEWSDAERLFGIVMSRQTVSPEVRLHYGAYLVSAGRVGEAIDQMRRAVQDDPLNLLNRAILSFCLLAGPQIDAAKECRRILELDENYYPAYYRLSILHTQIGNLNEAIASARRGHALAPWHMGLAGQLAGLLRVSGKFAEAETFVQNLGDGSKQGAALGLVSYHLLCRDIDQAAAWIEKAIEQRDPSTAAFLRFPMATMIRLSPNWPALAKKMNLPELPPSCG